MPPKLALDVPTFILASAMTALVQAGAMYFIHRTRKTYPGFGLWVLTYLAHGVGLLLLMARGLIPDFLSVVVSNVMTSGAPLLTWIGAQVFFGRPRPRWPFAGVLCLLAAGLAYYWYVEPNLSARVDNYFAQHSGVRFSHGICPDCLARLYPDVAEHINQKSRGAS
jgi:hypothetical protein